MVKKKSEEESELEQEIKEVESPKTNENSENQSNELEFQNQNFTGFQISPESFSPVLKKVETLQEPTNLEQGISFAPKPEEETIHQVYTTNEPNYSPSQERIKYQQNLEPPVLKPIRNQDELPSQEFLEPLKKRNLIQENQEIKRINVEQRQETTKLPFQQEKKYKEVKFR